MTIATLSEDEEAAVRSLSLTFRSGGHMRQALDAVEEKYGDAGWRRAAAQNALLHATALYVPSGLPEQSGKQFTFGQARISNWIQLLMKQVDEVEEVDEELICMAAECCAKEVDEKRESAVWIVLELGGREWALRVSQLFNEIGLRVWEAGCVLYERVIDGKSALGRDIHDSVVLEIGAGTGVCASAYERGEAKMAVLSDYDEKVVQNLRWNVAQQQEQQRIVVEQLDVYNVPRVCRVADRYQVQCVVAADVTYEPTLARAVIQAYERVISGTERVGYLLQTVRSDEGCRQLDQLVAQCALQAHLNVLKGRVQFGQSYTVREFRFFCKRDR